MRRLPLLCLLLLSLTLPCLGEEVAHLGAAWFSLDVPTGFAKSSGPSVSGGTLKTTSYTWKRAGGKPITLAASLSTYTGTADQEHGIWITRLRGPQQPGFSANVVADERLPGDLRAIRYWWAYKEKWEYRVLLLAPNHRTLTLGAWIEGSAKSPELKALVDGVAATVKPLK